MYVVKAHGDVTPALIHVPDVVEPFRQVHLVVESLVVEKALGHNLQGIKVLGHVLQGIEVLGHILQGINKRWVTFCKV